MIDLKRYRIVQETIEGQQVWPLKISVDSHQSGLSDHIFVFHASMGDDLYQGDIFEAVASVQQMRDLPEDAAGVDSNGEVCPYYRAKDLVFYARSPSEAEELWNAIVEDVNDLSRNWALLENIEDYDITAVEIILDENLNAASRQIVNLSKIGVGTRYPEFALDIDADNHSTSPARGIRFSEDVIVYRSGNNTLSVDGTLNVIGSLLIDGVPVEGATQSYTHSQAVASALWTVAHNLGFNPHVYVKDTAGSIVYGVVNYINTGQLEINFNGISVSGTAYLS
jgi:hypothetical protein